MKSNRKYMMQVYKFILMQVVYLGISFTLSSIVLILLFNIVDYFYRRSMFIQIIDTFKWLKNYFLGSTYFYILSYMLVTILLYLIISYKKHRNIALLIESVEIMASGDLDKRIDVNSKDDVGKVANNINHIIERLKNITVEERKAQQTKTDLITNVSHDLRTPLTSIIGYLNLIEEDKYKDEVHLRYYTNIAYEKAKNLNVLINDLFELTKLQNNSLPFNKLDINLVELVGQVSSYLDYEISKANMEIRLNFSDDKLIINGDPDKLVRVFENLINNAIKYGDEGRYIDIVTKKEENMGVVQIINYGEPIPQSDIPFIFDRFYRVEKSRNRNDGGSGLGLAITKNIIELHGGNILVRSDSSKTIFEIRIPLIQNNFN